MKSCVYYKHVYVANNSAFSLEFNCIIRIGLP